MPTENQSYDDAFKAGVNKVAHDIPYDYELSKMSFVELAIELASSKKDSPKFTVLEREIKKHLAKDQAKINRSNIILGACIGLAGVFIGGVLRSPATCNEISKTNTVQQLSNNKLPFTAVAPSVPAFGIQVINPTPVSNNAQPSQKHP